MYYGQRVVCSSSGLDPTQSHRPSFPRETVCLALVMGLAVIRIKYQANSIYRIKGTSPHSLYFLTPKRAGLIQRPETDVYILVETGSLNPFDELHRCR